MHVRGCRTAQFTRSCSLICFGVRNRLVCLFKVIVPVRGGAWCAIAELATNSTTGNWCCTIVLHRHSLRSSTEVCHIILLAVTERRDTFQVQVQRQFCLNCCSFKLKHTILYSLEHSGYYIHCVSFISYIIVILLKDYSRNVRKQI